MMKFGHLRLHPRKTGSDVTAKLEPGDRPQPEATTESDVA